METRLSRTISCRSQPDILWQQYAGFYSRLWCESVAPRWPILYPHRRVDIWPSSFVGIRVAYVGPQWSRLWRRLSSIYHANGHDSISGQVPLIGILASLQVKCIFITFLHSFMLPGMRPSPLSLFLFIMNWRPLIPDVKGPTNFSYWRIFVIVNIGN